MVAVLALIVVTVMIALLPESLHHLYDQEEYEELDFQLDEIAA